MDVVHANIVLSMSFEFILHTCIGDACAPLAIGIRTAATSCATQRSPIASDVLLVARIVTGRAIDLQNSSDEGLEEGGASCDNANIELETTQKRW